jgi:hypothetical protein
MANMIARLGVVLGLDTAEFNRGIEQAGKKLEQFSNLSAEESVNCFVGRGKTNGIWFLIEKSGKVRKKLELKR